jgi:hypothetical protein
LKVAQIDFFKHKAAILHAYRPSTKSGTPSDSPGLSPGLLS